MRDFAKTKIRYMRDPLPVRLGGLAANLARIRSNSDHPANRDVVMSIIHESKHFIEWTAAEAEPEIAVELVELQLQLARWQRTWEIIWPDTERRADVARQAKQWSDQVMDWSGLLN